MVDTIEEVMAIGWIITIFLVFIAAMLKVTR